MKKRILALITILILVISCIEPVFAVNNETNDWGLLADLEENESAGAPPGEFKIYIQVGDDTNESDRYLVTSVTGKQMRLWANKSTIKYSGASYYSNTAGRIVREWISLEDFTNDISSFSGVPIEYTSGDYFIMGEDLTKDAELIEEGYQRDTLTGNWYSYDSMIGTTRYYFPEWSEESEANAVVIPASIGIRSYGASSGMSDEMLDVYYGSCDFLWAYVVYYGQTSYNDVNYPYFYYGQDEASFRYNKDSKANQTIKYLLKDKIENAEKLLNETQIASSSETVAEGSYWATSYDYTQLENAYDKAVSDYSDENATNGACFEELEALSSANDSFINKRNVGTKSGFFWYDPSLNSYTITSSNQLWEFASIVNGEAYDETSGEYIDQDSFEGKTLILSCDIDCENSRVHIGTEECPFEGTFDGNGFEISNLKITFSKDVYSTEGYYTALFGHIGSKGTVDNLTVSGVSGSAKISDIVGGLSGLNEGLIKNCTSKITVTGEGSVRCGGLAALNKGVIKDSFNRGAVTGLKLTGGLAAENSGTIENSRNNASISSASGDTDSLTGTDSGSLKSCINVVKGNGDVNLDGKVSAKDALLYKKAEAGSANLDIDQIDEADINKDGTLTSVDRIRLRNMIGNN